MDDEFRYYVPTKLDQGLKILFWDFDVAMMFAGCFLLGMVFNFMWAGLVGGFLAAHQLNKVKQGKGVGYSMHLVYWWSPFGAGFKRFPPSHLRRFHG